MPDAGAMLKTRRPPRVRCSSGKRGRSYWLPQGGRAHYQEPGALRWGRNRLFVFVAAE